MEDFLFDFAPVPVVLILNNLDYFIINLIELQ